MAKTDTDGASAAGSGGDTRGSASTGATSGAATSGKAGKAASRKAGGKKASPKAAPVRTTSAKTTTKATAEAGTGKNGKNGKNGGKKAKATPTTSVTTGPGDVTAEVTTPEPVVPAARTAPESRPLAVRHPRKPAPAPRHSEDTAEVATADVTSDGIADAGSAPAAGREVALPASSSTVDELSRLAMVPVDVARRVLPERRLPFYLGVGALAVVGVVEWPLAVGASLAWEALRRRPAR